ncbi:MAG: alpha/beta fold hydrolase, partial [Xanthobacteraceae bacterium]
MVTPTVKTIPVKHCNFEAKIKTAGSGPPLVYLHAAGGPIWDPFVEGLSERFTVYAPHHPGTGETARDSIYAVESLWDLLLIYEEILDALALQSVPVVGTSFGGMMAFELAAHQPARISKIVALDPIGLWRDDAPVAPYMLLPP